MIAFSTIHENNLTIFHRNHFIFTVTDLKNTSIFKEHDLDNENHISVETCQRIFPNASLNTVSGLLLTAMRLKVMEGQNDFLFVFNDENQEESFDLINGFVQILNLEPTSAEQNSHYAELSHYASKWTDSLVKEEERFKRIGTIIRH